MRIGSIVLFADEAINFVKRRMHEGVLVDFHLYPGWYHNLIFIKNAYYCSEEEKNARHSLLQALKIMDHLELH